VSHRVTIAANGGQPKDHVRLSLMDMRRDALDDILPRATDTEPSPIAGANVLARQPRPSPMVLHAMGDAGCRTARAC